MVARYDPYMEKILVGGILQQSEGGIVVAQRFVDTRIGLVEEEDEP